MRGCWFQRLKARLSPNLFLSQTKPTASNEVRGATMHDRICHLQQKTLACKAGERESGVVYAKIPSLMRITEMDSSHLGEGLYQEKTTTSLYCSRRLELTNSHGAAGRQILDPAKVEAAKRELGTRVDVKLHVAWRESCLCRKRRGRARISEKE